MRNPDLLTRGMVCTKGVHSLVFLRRDVNTLDGRQVALMGSFPDCWSGDIPRLTRS
jgi:hypothetical protein